MRSNGNPVFVDRENETRRLRTAILSGQSLMITGARGMGKTALVLKSIAELPSPVKEGCLYVGAFKNLQDLLHRLIRALYEVRDRELRRELRAAAVNRASLDAWLKSLSSSRLRGTLCRTVESKQYRFFLDHCPALTPAMARVFRELLWMRQTPVYTITSRASEIAKADRYLFWGKKQVLRLSPLSSEAARKLIEDCIQRNGLAKLELEGFRKEVLDLSRLVPGAIVTMCRMAAQPRYQFGSQIKTRLIHIDYLMRGGAEGVKSARVIRPS